MSNALELAEKIEGVRAPYCGAAAAELRRLAAVEAENAFLEEMNAQLREQNDSVGKACAKYEAELDRIRAMEPVAWLSVDCIGERYLCFTKPNDSDQVYPLITLEKP